MLEFEEEFLVLLSLSSYWRMIMEMLRASAYEFRLSILLPISSFISSRLESILSKRACWEQKTSPCWQRTWAILHKHGGVEAELQSHDIDRGSFPDQFPHLLRPHSLPPNSFCYIKLVYHITRFSIKWKVMECCNYFLICKGIISSSKYALS